MSEVRYPLEPIVQDVIRCYASGATRDAQAGKPQYAGYIGWRALIRYGEYMLKHQTGPDGQPRAADNWKKGIPPEDYVDSLARHMVDFFAAIERGDFEVAEEAACAIWFNSQGWLFERLR